ncbi:MAG: hypothetical protein WC242_01175 [Candidatus Paceibacterota bacterium]
MAEAQQAIIVIPVVLEIIEVEVPIAIQVLIHVRHTVIASGT